MSEKVGLISDVHATTAPLREALQIFADVGASAVLCAGDVAGYGTELGETIRLLEDFTCRTVLGNHDLWQAKRAGIGEKAKAYLLGLPGKIELEISGRSMYMVHASPPDSLLDGIRLLDEEGRVLAGQLSAWGERLRGFGPDLLVVGHTHQVFARRLGNTLVINPGSTLFNHSCVLLSLPQMEVEFIPLGGKAIRWSWNWGMMGRAGSSDPG